MRILPATIPLLLAVPSAVVAQGHLQNVRWLEGCWEMTRGATRTIEKWSPASSGVMTGESRTVSAGTERESEKLRLFVRGDTLIYEATPSRQQLTQFKTLLSTGPELVFANPTHDFPQRIIYRRVGADSLVARIEGDRDNRRGPVSFPYKRVSCPASQDDAVFRATGAFFGISVPNSDSSRAWYVNKLGMRVTMEAREQGTHVIVVSGGGLTVEIVENSTAKPLGAAAREVHGPFKTGFTVEDFEGTMRRLGERGVTIAYGPYPAANGQAANAIVRDNAGNLIQIFGR